MKNCLINIKETFKKHWWGVAGAFIIGFLIILPTLLFFNDLGSSNFKGIYPVFNDDEVHYLAMAEDVYDGNLGMGNVFIKEHKNEPFVQPPLAELIFSGAAKVLRISIPALFMINDFILPFIGFISLYSFYFLWTKLKAAALAFSFIFYLLFLNTFNRPINPQFSFIFFVVGMILIWKLFYEASVKEKGWIGYNIFLGVVIGLLVYIYPYFWTPLAVIYALSILYKFISERNVYKVIKYSLAFLAPFLFIIAPYLLNFVRASSSPFFEETLLRQGVLSNHWPACFFNVFLVFLIGFILFLVKDRIEKKQLIFASILLLSSIILNWQNVVTGKYLQFSSHYYWVTVFFTLTVMFIIFNSFYLKLEKHFLSLSKKILLIILILVYGSLLFYKQRNEIIAGLFPRVDVGKALDMQGAREVLDWLNANTEPESVVFTIGMNDDWLIPVYTKNNLYSYGYAGYYLMSDQEMKERWIRQNIFLDKFDFDYIKENHRGIWLNKFIDQYQNEKVRNKIIGLFTNREVPDPILLPSSYIDDVLIKYNEVKKEDLRTTLKKYQIDYILYDKNKNPELKLDRNVFIKPVFQTNNTIIYKVL